VAASDVAVASRSFSAAALSSNKKLPTAMPYLAGAAGVAAAAGAALAVTPPAVAPPVLAAAPVLAAPPAGVFAVAEDLDAAGACFAGCGVLADTCSDLARAMLSAAASRAIESAAAAESLTAEF